ncbi:putative mannose-1-phosphate guanylyltransferase/mannose-6-phosphate isomerase [Clostridiales bacterium oral taxon 876 str. F0540]|nr:putative mannose-1-phosphate guanylyltransferase/mannose-6-phosphate isomerase [Clostridiales bacterium oral taxon 876 str. F0540]
MAGGKGERFWPLSTKEKPKQFLNLIGNDTMLQMTVKRLRNIIPEERIFIVTGQEYFKLVKEQLPNIPDRNIILEPVGKNTAACIGLSAFTIDKIYKDSTMIVVPSDHMIENCDNFIQAISAGIEFIEDNNNSIVTLGIMPSRPETGYGYIRYGETCAEYKKFNIKEVERFVEKPNVETACKYIDEGCYLWNSGMFIWKTRTILNLINKYLNNTFNILSEIALSCDTELQSTIYEKYSLLDSISIDYGILEKAEEIHVIPCDMGWDDLGSWNSIYRLLQKDDNGNVIDGDIVQLNTQNCLIKGEKKVIATLGVENLIVVDTCDGLLVCAKKYEQNVKDILKQMKNKTKDGRING